ncbi:MAG: hypothetical protein M1832_000303 [Thelocarpon impressellum]|nr:MAG: hypothetical protein M1832_000303 [Thelocarpon impressellum]
MVLLKLMRIFHSFYDEWKENLARDQEDAAAKTGLYRYRGGQEEDEEADQADFAELFPDFETAETTNTGAKNALRSPNTPSSHLAGLHRDIFIGGGSPSGQIMTLLQGAEARVEQQQVQQATATVFTELNERLLPRLILALGGLQDSLSSTAGSSANGNYNFYTDANLTEARKLVEIAHKVIHRFAQLQEAWPEHATLQDVLTACDELLDFRHVEPVAKFLTKVEKVHGYIYEWQVVASKEFSALGVYEDLTALIVSWRRLELSTWTRLFDIEDEKCKTDAMAWWSIAYEVVIAAPLSISESGAEVKKHSVDLLAALETFFTTTTLGQYSQRVRLLKQFLGHSLMIAQNVESMSAISDALSNFIEFYSRFESQIDNVLQRGRRALEKEIKDVVLLASWKDTNINALRESAKRSHHKLFKLVRKYRALLGQSAGPLLAQGLQEASPTETAELSFEMITPSLNTRALEICQNTIPGWPEKPTRLVNIYSTLGNMRRMSRLPNGTLDGAEYLESFSGDLIASIEALQKETPTRLTDENKDKVKHLKSRKRKLFADTLRELRQMGFKHNLGANVLAEQADIPTILAKAKPFPRGDTKGALGAINSYFHRVVDLMPRLRQTLTNHSEELTGAEMTRSTGYIEGMLLELLKQHDILAASLEQFSGLDVASQKLQNLWADGGHALQGSHSHVAQRGLRRSVQWLPRLLELGHRIIGTQDKLGGVDNSEVQQVMKTHMDALTDVARRSRELPTTPKGTSTSVHASLQSEASAIIAALRAALAAWSVKYPQLAFMTNQVLPWVDEDWAEIEGAVSSNEKVDGRSGSTLIELDRRLSRSCDSILVALQKMQGSASTLPSSTENAAWLLRLEKGLATSLKELRAPEITSLLEKAMDDLALVDLSEAESALAAAALSAMAAPIVRQYAQICRDAMQKYADLHRSSCKTVYILAKSFHQIATQGFCTPSDESSTADGKEKLEEGTGLGEGQGAEDISRDIQDDEDLSELAQEPNTTDEKGDIEDEKDAVDIQDEMEGETEDGQKGEDEETGSGEEEQDEVDEEAGSVNDLDPTAVDEKLWDGDGEEAEKDQEGHESKGKTDKDEQAAAEERKEDEGKGQPDDEDEIEEGGVDEEEQIGRAEPETTDPQAPEEEALDLPEDMDLDGDEKSQQGDIDDDGMEDLSDVDDGQEAEGEGEDMDEEVDDAPADLDGVDSEAGDTEGDFEEGEKTQDADPDSREEEEGAEEDQGLLQERTEDVKASGDDVAASEMQGVGDDQEQMDDEDKGNPDSNAQRSEGAKGNPSAAGKSGAEERETGDAEQNAHGGREEEESLQDTAQTRAFKKLGDALERWHRKQKKIHPASEEQEKQQQEVERDGGEFEHLQDEEAEADTQALGAATEEQANALDESMGMDSDSKQMPDNFVDGEAEGEQDKDEDVEMEDNSGAPEGETSEDVRSRAIVGEAGRPGERVIEKSAEDSPDENMDDTSQHLSTMQLSTTAPAFLSEAGARALWSQYEASTRTLSQTLTEQLRLILHPSVATKLRGDFRTGKRLNIKRIIPYIASQYRRDKIWLRRATPHKRAYQILLAVDDSSSMAEHSAGHRALETLVMVARSLTMLEAGQMAVVAFGSTATIAHAFETPFSHDAGAAVLRHFGFKQSRTDVRALLQSSLALFREARARPGGASEELWQLQFIISDGLSEDREAVARLVREALRERIMIVFLIVDPSSPPEDGGKGKGKSTSIMAMTSASFDADGTVKVSRYLDGFPFPYYIVVGDVRELPGVLAGALRGWFGEIVGEGG